MIKKSNLNIVILFILICSSAIGYIPNLERFTKITYILFVLVIILNIKNFIVNIYNNKQLLVLNIALFTFYGISTIINGEVSYLLFIYLILSQMIIISLMNTWINPEKIDKLLLYSAYSIVICSIVIILSYQGSYSYAIKNIGQYFMSNKNAFSPMLSFSIIYIFYMLLYRKINLLSIIFFLIGLLNIVIIQSRTNILMTICVISIMLIIKIKNIKSKFKILYILLVFFCLFILFLLFSSQISQILSDIFRIEYFLTRTSDYGIIDKLTTGRITSYMVNIHLLSNNVIFGSGFDKISILNDPQSATGIHNVWVRALFYGGIVYMSIFLALIRKLYLIIIKYNSNQDILLIVFFLIGGFINSNFEPFAPFGPGTSYIIFWIVISMHIKTCKSEVNNE